jgi:exodeoxyribonuclease VII small subunit
MNPTENLSYEAAYEELAGIIDQLESGQLPLDESMTLFERGRALIKRCETLLNSSELRVNQLSADGQIESLR